MGSVEIAFLELLSIWGVVLSLSEKGPESPHTATT